MSRTLVDSGIKWIGKIPEDWSYLKCKYLTSITTGKKDANDGSVDGIYPFFTCSAEDKRIDTYSFDTEALLVAGNGIVGFTRYYNGKFDAYQRTYVISDFKNVNPIFMKYYFNGLLTSKLETDKVGSVIDFIKLGDLKDFIIVMPNKEEQNRIAEYLDKKCSKIDKVIEDNNKEIELLEEYKNNYVSDVFSELSTHYNNVKLKYLGNFQNGISASKDKFGVGNGTFINYGDVYNYNVIPSNPVGVIELSEEEAKTYSLKRGDILFTRTSETIEEVGISSVCIKDYPNSAFSGFVIRFRPYDETMIPEFYKYYFNLVCHRDYFAKEMNLVTRASLSQGLLGGLNVIVPGIEMQKKVAKDLDDFCIKIDKVIEYRKQIIEKLEEYKKSLIYEVVTGKKEV